MPPKKAKGGKKGAKKAGKQWSESHVKCMLVWCGVVWCGVVYFDTKKDVDNSCSCVLDANAEEGSTDPKVLLIKAEKEKQSLQIQLGSSSLKWKMVV